MRCGNYLTGTQKAKVDLARGRLWQGACASRGSLVLALAAGVGRILYYTVSHCRRGLVLVMAFGGPAHPWFRVDRPVRRALLRQNRRLRRFIHRSEEGGHGVPQSKGKRGK